MTPIEKVNLYLDITARYPHASFDEHAELLRSEAVNDDDAECLIAFVPMAFAHAVLASLGVGLPTKFLVKSMDKGDIVSGLLQEEPIFVAARNVAVTMLSCDTGRQRVLEVAAGSAEMQVAKKLLEADGSLHDIVLTEPVLLRLSAEYIVKKNIKPAWKFWQ